jgi:hypothetical protein
MDADPEHLLICTGMGVISIETLLFGVEVTQQVRKGCFVILCLLCIFLVAEVRLIAPRCSRIVKTLFPSPSVPASVATSLGIVSKVRYLEEKSPGYQQAEAINRVVDSQARGGKTLVFLRHMYSLDVPFLNGDPATSWMINPDRFRTPQDWELFFQEEGISFVVRSPSYPPEIAPALAEMEATGDLVPVARPVVQDFQGKHIEAKRVEIPVIIPRVQSPAGR